MSSPLPLGELRALMDELRADDRLHPDARRDRLRAEQKANLDAMNAMAADGGRLGAMDQRLFDVAKTAFDLIDAELKTPTDRQRRENESAAVRNANPAIFGASVGRYEREDREQAQVRAWLNGEGPRQLRIPVRNAMRQREAIRNGVDPSTIQANLYWDTGSIASGVPTFLAEQLYEVLEGQVAMLRMPTTKILTETGADMDFPRLTTHTLGTQVIAQGTAIGGTDPVFAKTTFGAYKYGALIGVANETIQDTGFDLLSLVARDSGRAVGRLVDADLVVGSGSGEPNGVMTAIGGAGTIATGGSLITPTYEKLIDLQYSINNEYRNSGNAAWLMYDTTAGTLRKLRDGAGGTIGAPLWQASVTGGVAGYRQPDLLLGDPAFTDVNVASMASNAKIIAYGDWSAYYIRHVQDIVFERSDDYAFNQDVVFFRTTWRVDGDLLDTAAINIMKQNV